ncbi:MAG: nicotinate-nucleotide--dimethylbenzimidazole phosphoribosyltransferase [Chloroflexota bacterium]
MLVKPVGLPDELEELAVRLVNTTGHMDWLSQRGAVVVDGVICAVAVLIAHQMHPDGRHYVIARHMGAEPGHARTLAHLRLGEGTGALLAIEAAARTLNEMRTLNLIAQPQPVDGAACWPVDCR